MYSTMSIAMTKYKKKIKQGLNGFWRITELSSPQGTHITMSKGL